MASDDNSYLTPNEVASMLLVSPITVRQWAQKGLLPAQTTAGGHRRFLKADVRQFASARGIALPGEQRHILVVDDDQQLNSYLVALLQTSLDEVTVHSALDGFAAGRLVAAHAPDVVVLDIMMPGMNGVEVCQAIKADPATAHAVVIAMTGHHTDELQHRVLAAGAIVLLKKPFASDDLLSHIKNPSGASSSASFSST